MPELACFVVADDLTGACDAAVQFSRCARVSVILRKTAPPPDAGVVAMTTESRHMSETRASLSIQRAAQFAQARLVFKKIDSVLRGHPGAEIAAAVDAFGCDAAVTTPAFPALGRVVDEGNREAVAQSLRSDVHAAADGIALALASGARVVSADASCDADLDAIVAAAMADGRRILWAGSGGLAAALARAMERGSLPPVAMPKCEGRVVFVIGSDHAVTLRQLARLREVQPQSTVLPLCPVDAPGALVLSGGDTAAAVCRKAGAQRIELFGEILPGIPWGVLRGGRFDGVPVATKSGGFGADDALIRIAEFFQ